MQCGYTTEEVLEMIRALISRPEYGTQDALAKAWGMHPSQMSRVMTGRDEPTPIMRERLGLQRLVIYAPLNSDTQREECLMSNTFAEILNTVVENGRVLAHEDGTFVTASLVAEVEFEASERGLSPAEMSEAIAFTTAHANHHE